MAPCLLAGLCRETAWLPLLPVADEAVIRGRGEFDRREALGVQPDDQFYVVVMDTDKAHHVFGLRPGEDAFGG